MTEELKLQLFEQKQKFLREIPHPKLILKEMRILQRINPELDLTALTFEKIKMNADEKSTPLESFLESHILNELLAKQKISQALDVSPLFEALHNLFKQQVLLLKKLQSYLPTIAEGIDKDVKMSVPFDTYNMLKRIRELNLKEKEIKDYLCNVIKAQEKPFRILVENCLRANKILSHV
ncbi:MAG: hypothetical protein GQ574_08570 [Crocinitomix sp.]|nr:hypothetical protein [Crocinitomix sp.]